MNLEQSIKALAAEVSIQPNQLAELRAELGLPTSRDLTLSENGILALALVGKARVVLQNHLGN